jgi:hypothetical protein
MTNKNKPIATPIAKMKKDGGLLFEGMNQA